MMTKYYPDVNFSLPHMGRFSPDFFIPMGVPDFVASHKDMLSDTSATRDVKYLERAAKAAPIARMISGSCGPHLDARVARQTICLLELPEEQEAQLTGGNILKLLKL